MTVEQANHIVETLKKGQVFSTRFQEIEWGIHYQDNGQFQKTTHEFMQPQARTQLLEEAAVLELFLRYNYERILQGLT